MLCKIYDVCGIKTSIQKVDIDDIKSDNIFVKTNANPFIDNGLMNELSTFSVESNKQFVSEHKVESTIKSEFETKSNWNWNEEKESSLPKFDNQQFTEKVNKFNFRIMSTNNDDEKDIAQNRENIRSKNDLCIPRSVKSDSNYADLKHGYGEPCNIFPIPSVDDTLLFCGCLYLNG
eukprot:221366_1